MASQKKILVEVPAYTVIEVPANALQGLINAEVWEYDYKLERYYLSRKPVQVKVVDAESCTSTYRPKEEDNG